jgi:hypothetical protein
MAADVIVGLRIAIWQFETSLGLQTSLVEQKTEVDHGRIRALAELAMISRAGGNVLRSLRFAASKIKTDL